MKEREWGRVIESVRERELESELERGEETGIL